jgi:hypothetical protein
MKKALHFFLNPKGHPYLFWGLVLIRGIFNFSLPLMDKTEARYAEIARIMAETGNWVVPHIDYGVPFWAKPPLSTWASALSIFLFGDHAFFVRLPLLTSSRRNGTFFKTLQKREAVPIFQELFCFACPNFICTPG